MTDSSVYSIVMMNIVHCLTFRQLALQSSFYQCNFRKVTVSVRSEHLAGPGCNDVVKRPEVLTALNMYVIGSGM